MSDLKKIDQAMLDRARELPAPRDQISDRGSDTPPATVRGIPLARVSDTFKTFDLRRNPGMKTAVAQCQAIAAGRQWCAFLGGDYGTGKTHLAIATLNAWIAQHGTGIFWKVPDFLQWLRRAIFDGGWEVDDLTQGYRTGNALLVLDDLGTENPTDWANEQLYRVLDARYESRLPTILTTNRGIERIDGRILSRFREGLIICKGRDIRATKEETTA